MDVMQPETAPARSPAKGNAQQPRPLADGKGQTKRRKRSGHIGAWVEPRRDGLYLPTADAWIDPAIPVARALVTHGHADHARSGHGAVWATPETLAIMGVRYGDQIAGHASPIGYGERLDIGGGITASFHPAGHVLGSAQIRLERDGEVVVV